MRLRSGIVVPVGGDKAPAATLIQPLAWEIPKDGREKKKKKKKKRKKEKSISIVAESPISSDR